MTVVLGDLRDVLPGLDAESVDACVCDPPYELDFMGKRWDSTGVAFLPETWRHVWRVLKPGGYLLAFGGTRTYHRLAVAIEDAGFEIRDTIAWMYGSGFPKSLDAAKAIDAKLGASGGYGEPKTAAHAGWIDRGRMRGEDGHEGYQRPWMDDEDAVDRNAREYLPATEEARARRGWGTALKPAFEPVVVARKPLVGTVAANLLEYGVGAINIDGCRIGTTEPLGRFNHAKPEEHCVPDSHPNARNLGRMQQTDALVDNSRGLGRWPANVVLDPEAAEMLDEQTGERKGGGAIDGRPVSGYGSEGWPQERHFAGYADSGGASRFFYTAKTSRAERNAGLDGFDKRPMLWSSGEQNPGSFQAEGTDRAARNNHPTVKPIALMRWLVRLVAPPGGRVLDPFLGSGTTGIAAVLEGLDFVGVERDPDYLAIAEARIRFWQEHGEQALDVVRARDEADRRRADVAESGQLDLLGETA